MPPGVHAYESGHEVSFPSDEGMMLPERLFERGPISLPEEWKRRLGDREMAVIPVSCPPAGRQRGLWLVRGSSHGVWTLEDIAPFGEDSPFMGVRMRPLYLQEQLYDAAAEVKDLQLVALKIGPAAMFVFKQDADMLYLLGLGMSDHDCIVSITDKDGNILCPDGWTTDKNGDSYWKRLVEKKRRTKMKGLGNPVAPKTAPVPAPAPATAPEPEPEETQEVVDAPLPVQETRQAEEPAQAEAATEASDAKPSRRRVTRESKAVGLDLTKVIEDVSAPVEDLTVDQLDKAQEEVRQLRDLGIAVLRRSANLTAAMLKISKPAVDKLISLQALLK